MKILRKYGQLDTLNYYKEIAPALVKFLKGKEIAVKNLIPHGPKLLKRGSKLEPLYIQEFIKGVDEDFLKNLRKMHLRDARPKLTKLQAKIWSYFLPRKLNDFLYATNNEGAGKDIDRIFFDIDRVGVSKNDARKVALELINRIQDDKIFDLKYKFFIMYTGSSFHVYLILKNKIKNSYYDTKIHLNKSYSSTLPYTSFTEKWASAINKKINIKIVAGHERIKRGINIDPSQTPSGKLARAPFSLHMKDPKIVDGVAIPISLKQLGDKKVISWLEHFTPDNVIDEIKELKKNIVSF